MSLSGLYGMYVCTHVCVYVCLESMYLYARVCVCVRVCFVGGRSLPVRAVSGGWAEFVCFSGMGSGIGICSVCD